MVHRSSRTSFVVVAITVALVTGCRWLDLMGLAHTQGTPPDEPGLETPWGWPVLVLTVRDTVLTVGDTETATGELYTSPVTRYSKPYGAYADSTRQFTVADSSVVAAEGLLITAARPGKTSLQMSGYSGAIPISGTVTVRVMPKP